MRKRQNVKVKFKSTTWTRKATNAFALKLLLFCLCKLPPFWPKTIFLLLAFSCKKYYGTWNYERGFWFLYTRSRQVLSVADVLEYFFCTSDSSATSSSLARASCFLIIYCKFCWKNEWFFSNSSEVVLDIDRLARIISILKHFPFYSFTYNAFAAYDITKTWFVVLRC